MSFERFTSLIRDARQSKQARLWIARTRTRHQGVEGIADRVKRGEHPTGGPGSKLSVRRPEVYERLRAEAEAATARIVEKHRVVRVERLKLHERDKANRKK